MTVICHWGLSANNANKLHLNYELQSKCTGSLCKFSSTVFTSKRFKFFGLFLTNNSLTFRENGFPLIIHGLAIVGSNESIADFINNYIGHDGLADTLISICPNCEQLVSIADDNSSLGKFLNKGIGDDGKTQCFHNKANG